MHPLRVSRDVEALVLEALRHGPAHGYALLEVLRGRRARALCRSEGVLYSTLHRLERQGLIASEWSEVDGRRRRIYWIRATGERSVARRWISISALTNRFRNEDVSMKLRLVVTSLSLLIVVASLSAQAPTDFSGTWVMNAAKGKNLGMMANLQDTVRISQTPTELVVKHTSSFQGQQNTRELRYALDGKTVGNDGPMGDHNDTVAKWVGRTLVTTWTKEGAVAGTKSVMTETRSLSSDGKTMTLESVRGSNAPVVMVYERQ
jgi:PadR family transcriptional regulator PadR